MTFLHKRVGEGAGTFGGDLQDLRELRGFTVEQVARDTKIRDTIIRALENDRLQDIEDPAFMERHLLTYVRFLGGYEPYFLARYRAKLDLLQARRTTRDLLPRALGVRGWDLMVGPHLLGVLGILALALALGGYVWWQAQAVGTPPPLEIQSPADGERLMRPSVVVRGQTMPEAFVRVNGHDAAVNSEGAFELTLDVRRGTTIITIVAQRRRGSETRVVRRVVYDRPLQETELLDLSGNTSTATSTR
ncbi:MAG TPA: helix-turn-helix domain-containing protein [Candidatus Methylomirabilis sp.]|nr:helix-turn-helix domain-containing protein [Candidatus Methylomirabilis sp.]